MRQPERSEMPVVGDSVFSSAGGVLVAANVGQHTNRGEQMKSRGPGLPFVEKHPGILGIR